MIAALASAKWSASRPTSRSSSASSRTRLSPARIWTRDSSRRIATRCFRRPARPRRRADRRGARRVRARRGMPPRRLPAAPAICTRRGTQPMRGGSTWRRSDRRSRLRTAMRGTRFAFSPLATTARARRVAFACGRCPLRRARRRPRPRYDGTVIRRDRCPRRRRPPRLRARCAAQAHVRRSAGACGTGRGARRPPDGADVRRDRCRDGQGGRQGRAGAPLIVLEAMKMEHTIVAPADGVVASVNFGVGDRVAEGADLVDIEDAMTLSVRRPDAPLARRREPSGATPSAALARSVSGGAARRATACARSCEAGGPGRAAGRLCGRVRPVRVAVRRTAPDKGPVHAQRRRRATCCACPTCLATCR